MRIRVVWPLLALITVALAGCAGDSGEEDALEKQLEDSFGDVKASSGKGIIRGVVVDDTITPIPEATVAVKGTGINVTSDENGLFLVKDIEPGTYFLVVSKFGFETIQSSVEVEADVDNPAIVRVQLPIIPGLEPRYVPLRWDGHIGCTFRRPGVPEVTGAQGTSCPAVQTLWPDHDFYVDYELDQVPSWVQSTIQWESTQHFGGEMSFNLRRSDAPSTDTTDIEGTSPLVLDMGPELIAQDPDHELRGGFGPDVPVRVIIFTAHLEETEPPWGGWGFGLQIDQPFSTYTQIFYNQEPPNGWQYITDGDP